MKITFTMAFCVGISAASWAAGKTSVDLELHNSTTSLSAANDIRSSTGTSMSTGVGDAAHLETLDMALRNPNEHGKLKALNDIAALGGKAKSVTPDLLHLLLDPTAGVSAAHALQTVDPSTPVPTVTLMRLVRRAQVLPQREHVRTGWLTQCDSQISALDTLAALGPAAHLTLPDLVKLTHRFCVHDHVVAALDAIGTPDAAQIVQIAAGLDDKNPETRQAAIEFLAKSRSNNDGTLKILGHAMNDGNSGVRLSALQALEDIHPEGEGRLPLLIGYLLDPSSEIRARTVYMIGQLAPNSATAKPLLYQALKDSEPAIALTSAKLLATIDPQDPVLRRSLLGFMKVKGSAEAMQSAQLLESLNIHDAQVDAALEPYRTQEALWQHMSKASSVPPEQLAENARSLNVRSIRIASGILNGQPVHVGHRFQSTVGRIYCWTDISVSSAPASVTHRWFRNGRLAHEETLEVSRPSIPLWSSTVATAGDWNVKIFPAGSSEALATAAFTVHRSK